MPRMSLLVALVVAAVIEERNAMLPNWIFIPSLIGLIVLFMAGTAVQVVVKRRLKKYYANNPNVPDVTFNPLDHSASQAVSFLRFLAQRQYGNLKDARLTRDCNTLRILYICYLAVFAWVVFTILAR